MAVLKHFFEIWTVQLPLGLFFLGALFGLCLFYHAIRFWLYLTKGMQALKRKNQEQSPNGKGHTQATGGESEGPGDDI